MKFQYQIYGLKVNSSRKINLLTEQTHHEPDLEVYWTTDPKNTPDIYLRWRKHFAEESTEEKRRKPFWTSKTENGTYSKIRFNAEKSHVDFLLDSSRKKLWIIHHKDELESDLNSYFVGPGLGFILRLRDNICLHASVVNINNKAAIFLGHKRSGKSTTAAALAKLGYKVLADDIAVITPNGKSFYVQPGYPKIRLRSKPAELLLDKAAVGSLAKVYNHQSSLYLPLEREEKFYSDPLPLGAIYLLGCINHGDTTPFLEALTPPEKLLKLTENVIARYITNAELQKKEFLLLASLINKIPIKKLMFGHDLNTLQLQCKTIIDDFIAQLNN